MNKLLRILLIALLITLGVFFFINVNQSNNTNTNNNQPEIVETTIAEDGKYTSKEDVALYIHTYNKLPSNYVNKNDAKKLGWVASKGNLTKVCEGCSIGGDVFGNREKILPSEEGRTYYECDIDYVEGTRNAKRIVYSNDGLVYYTEDHYNTFELLYGEP